MIFHFLAEAREKLNNANTFFFVNMNYTEHWTLHAFLTSNQLQSTPLRQAWLSTNGGRDVYKHSIQEFLDWKVL